MLQTNDLVIPKTLKILRFPDYDSLSRAAAEHMYSTVSESPEAVFCLATGSTPTATYQYLSELNTCTENRFRHSRIVKLDEWGGLPENHQASCESYLRKYIIQPLEIENQNYISFQSDAADPENECNRISSLLASSGRIDLSVLGLGINGHLGFNEPAEQLSPLVHVASLTETTQQHPMVKETTQKPTFGYTLGIANLLQSKSIILLVSGTHKESQLKRLLSQKIETQFPASFLWLHPDVTVYTDINSH